MSVIEISDDATFGDKLSEAGSRLVVCDFFATWCGPCNMIAPFFKQLATKYPNAMFIKIDVDKCQGTAMANNVSAMPTFVFMRNRSELDRIRGADRNQLENKVKQYYSSTDGASTSAGAAGGEAGAAAGALEGEFIDLVSNIHKGQSECLNQSDDHTWEHALTPSTTTFLESDVDEQLLLFISFMQPIKLNALVIQSPGENGPKNIRLFINQTRTLDFDSAEKNQSVQDLELKPEDLKDNTLVKLKYVKFQNVQNITLFVSNNQDSSDKTVISYLKFIGSPVSVTNMNDFKRVSGQAGEAHG